MNISRIMTESGNLETSGFWFEDTADGRVIHIELTPDEIASIGGLYAIPMYLGDVKELWTEQLDSYLQLVYHHDGSEVGTDGIINDYIDHILSNIEDYSLDDLRDFDPANIDDMVWDAFNDICYPFIGMDIDDQLEALKELCGEIRFTDVREAIDFARYNAWFSHNELIAYKEEEK